MNAEAFATGSDVAFRRGPSLRTAAHEAAHVIQQRRGAAPSGGVGRAGDALERHADRVASKVVAGESAEKTLAEVGDDGVSRTTAVQRSEGEPEVSGATQAPPTGRSSDDLETKRQDALEAVTGLSLAFGAFSRKVIAWQSEAWNLALGQTGSDPLVALTAGEWNDIFMAPFGSIPAKDGSPVAGELPAAESASGGKSVVLDAAGNATAASAINVVGKKAVAAAGGAAGSAVLGVLTTAFEGAGPPGWALAILVNAVWSAVSDKIFPDRGEREVAAVGNVMNYKDSIEQKIHAKFAGAAAHFERTVKSLQLAIRRSESVSDLEGIKAWLGIQSALFQLQNLDPDACAKAILSHWVRQHARTYDEPVEGTTPAAFEKAQAASSVGRKDVETTGHFIDQIKLVLASRGVDIGPPITQLTAMHGALRGATAEIVVSRLDRMLVPLPLLTSPERFAAGLPAAPSFGPALEAPESPLQALCEGNVDIDCTIRLTATGETVGATGLVFRAVPKDGCSTDDGVCSDARSPARFSRREWSVDI